ncbi:MAG: Esa1p-associated factor [Piccolia ochrophora]|nr:MAG: Esa1p-associated factor [Piccolia ochrophora]
MAPANQPMFGKDEKALCFHLELLYEAKVLEARQDNPLDKKSPWEYRVHYKGWKNTWDDWVPQDRLRKFTEENRELASNLRKEVEEQMRAATGAKKNAASHKKKGAAGGSDFSSARGSEERHSSVQAGGPRGQKRGRDFDIEREDHHLSTPRILLPLPPHLKSLLVDDWESVTKNLQLVPLPSRTPANTILETYLAQELPKRGGSGGGADADVLEEVIAGLREYFDKCLGRILLYRFEREQFFDVRGLWEGGRVGTGYEPAAKEEVVRKGPGDVYGVEHLTRLFGEHLASPLPHADALLLTGGAGSVVSLPELIAQTNMDAQAVSRLKEELSKLTSWLAKHSAEYFTNEYENTSQEYQDKARGVL